MYHEYVCTVVCTAYLKMFQLRDEVIKGYREHYDMILVDEAQDLTPGKLDAEIYSTL